MCIDFMLYFTVLVLFIMFLLNVCLQDVFYYDELSFNVWLFPVFFFFKQKAAYEMRISDWSSDVCSSDLAAAAGTLGARAPQRERACRARLRRHQQAVLQRRHAPDLAARAAAGACRADAATDAGVVEAGCGALSGACLWCTLDHPRSEEHTSELQSLMRISYAVFCLKKKKKQTTIYKKSLNNSTYQLTET